MLFKRKTVMGEVQPFKFCLQMDGTADRISQMLLAVKNLVDAELHVKTFVTPENYIVQVSFDISIALNILPALINSLTGIDGLISGRCYLTEVVADNYTGYFGLPKKQLDSAHTNIILRYGAVINYVDDELCLFRLRENREILDRFHLELTHSTRAQPVWLVCLDWSEMAVGYPFKQ